VELRLEPLDGISLPQECYVSVRVGETQRLSKLSGPRTFRFPSGADGGVGKIEIFRRVGACNFEVNPSTDADREVRIGCSDSVGELGLRVHMERDGGAMKEEMQDPSETSNTGAFEFEGIQGVRGIRKMKEYKEYLNTHGMNVLLSEALSLMLRERPDQPVDFLVERLKQSKPFPVVETPVPVLHVETPAIDGKTEKATTEVARPLSWPREVAKAGGPAAWNQRPELAPLAAMLDGMADVRTADDALSKVRPLIQLGHHLWAHMWMKALHVRNLNIYYEAILRQPSLMLPVMYTPTVGEVCQKYGMLPFSGRGCYLSVADRGRAREVLEEYARAELERDAEGRPVCDCIVFSDGGRILGLGDLGAWGMGIPVGKLDLYTVCGGVSPHRVIPLIIDAGCGDASKNTDRLEVREHPLYTGLRQDRAMQRSAAGTMVNSCYYGQGSIIRELFEAATDLFGDTCLLQFEDFNSNDAFPLLAEYREKYLTYNDDIQGTAAVAVAGIMGAIKIKHPDCADLIGALRKETFLFFGAGSANIGAANLLLNEGGVEKHRVLICGSKGLIWVSQDGSQGVFKNEEQKALAYKGKPKFACGSLVDVIRAVKPTVLVGAVGVSPNCFTKEVVDGMMKSVGSGGRPIIFALSNPKSQSEITAVDCYRWSSGAAIFGSGTHFDAVEVGGKRQSPGQVNNVYIFPGMSFGAICCQARTIPERFFLVAAEAVANSLSQQDFDEGRVIPHRDQVQLVNLNVATAVVLEAQKMSLARRALGADADSVRATLEGMMWKPGSLTK